MYRKGSLGMVLFYDIIGYNKKEKQSGYKFQTTGLSSVCSNG